MAWSIDSFKYGINPHERVNDIRISDLDVAVGEQSLNAYLSIGTINATNVVIM